MLAFPFQSSDSCLEIKVFQTLSDFLENAGQTPAVPAGANAGCLPPPQAAASAISEAAAEQRAGRLGGEGAFGDFVFAKLTKGYPEITSKVACEAGGVFPKEARYLRFSAMPDYPEVPALIIEVALAGLAKGAAPRTPVD